MPLRVQRDGPLPIAEQIAEQLMTLLRSGRLRAGQRLPPVRVLAGFLRVNRNTVGKVYAALERTGFFGPDAYYMNHERNAAYAKQARNGGKLDMPVLFLHGDYDYTCETVVSRLAEPMRQDCSNLSEVIIQSGHWMAQEKPVEVNAAVTKWLATALPGIWQAL